MLEFFRKLFFSSDFMPHGHCYLWNSGTLWLHVISDSLIFIAYGIIPLSLLYLVWKRRDIAFEWMFVMFGVFILACGTTHLLDVITVWTPVYRLAGLIKAITAFASVSTAILLWRIMPRMLALPSPNQLRESNRRLELEGAARANVEADLRQSRDDLEDRVRERTAELAQANAELRTQIAGRQQVQAAAQASENMFHSILDHAPTPIFLKDHDDRYLLANESFAALCGLPILEIIGKTGADLHLAGGVTASSVQDQLVFSTGTPQEFEELVPGEEGERVFRSLRFRLPGANGAPEMLGVISRDDTARKRAERALQIAREEAERANAAKSEFLSRMSHELRTPMNAILGFAQLLEIDNPSPRQTSSLNHILKGGRHLLELINEVLDLARVEAGHMSLSPEPVNACEVIQESIDLIRPLANQRSLSLENHFGPDSESWILTDRQRLKQILVNFLSNAVKFNRNKGTITVSCKAVSPNLLRICVRDTGPGIAPADQQRIFSAFERLAADQAGVEGTGLGLALAKRLTDLMGGTITVESVLGEGTNFCLELPRTVAPEQAPPEEPKTPPLSEQTGQTRTVLYIEDNLSNLDLVESILEGRPDIRLLPAIQGGLGLKLAHEHLPDLILLDLDLPDMHGKEVLGRLRADPATQKIPVIVVSANAMPRVIEQMTASGANAYLTKPINVRDFLRLLSEQFDAKTGSAGPKPPAS